MTQNEAIIELGNTTAIEQPLPDKIAAVLHEDTGATHYTSKPYAESGVFNLVVLFTANRHVISQELVNRITGKLHL